MIDDSPGSAIPRASGLGAPIIAFAVRKFSPAKTKGSSLGPLADYITVDFVTGTESVLAHEMGHACNLTHTTDDTDTSLMNTRPSSRDPQSLSLASHEVPHVPPRRFLTRRAAPCPRETAEAVHPHSSSSMSPCRLSSRSLPMNEPANWTHHARDDISWPRSLGVVRRPSRATPQRVPQGSQHSRGPFSGPRAPQPPSTPSDSRSQAAQPPSFAVDWPAPYRPCCRTRADGLANARRPHSTFPQSFLTG